MAAESEEEGVGVGAGGRSGMSDEMDLTAYLRGCLSVEECTG